MSFLINPYAFLAAGGDFESIATITVGSGGASEIEFASIPSTYQHLQIRYIARTNRTGNTDDFMAIRFNSDNGSNYVIHLLYGTGTSALATAATSQTMSALGIITATDATASIFGAGVADILDYNSTSKTTTIRSMGSTDRNGAGQVRLNSGMWTSTNAVTSITLLPFTAGVDFVQHTTAALFGVKAP